MRGLRVSRPARAFGLALGIALASGVALAAWSANADLPPPAAPLLPRGALLDRLLGEAQASPTQRAQSHQIFDAADTQLLKARGDERRDRAQIAQLFAQPVVDAAAVEAVRQRIEARHDAQSRRATQALIDVSLVLNASQRQTIARQLADAPSAFAGLPHPHPALAVNE
ncbi:MAG: periplasmic heavy metal sensor [Betaproteobacteria bacterium]